MPLPKARKGAKKAARENVASNVMHMLSREKPSMPRKQKIAIAMKQAGLSQKGGRRK